MSLSESDTKRSRCSVRFSLSSGGPVALRRLPREAPSAPSSDGMSSEPALALGLTHSVHERGTHRLHDHDRFARSHLAAAALFVALVARQQADLGSSAWNIFGVVETSRIAMPLSSGLRWILGPLVEQFDGSRAAGVRRYRLGAEGGRDSRQDQQPERPGIGQHGRSGPCISAMLALVSETTIPILSVCICWYLAIGERDRGTTASTTGTPKGRPPKDLLIHRAGPNRRPAPPRG